MTALSNIQPSEEWEYSVESLALIRSLGKVAGNVPEYITFAQDVCASVPSAKEAAVLLNSNNYVALSQTGREALESLGVALEGFLTLSTSTKQSIRSLETALQNACALLEASTERLYSCWDSRPDILSHKDSQAFLAFHSELIQAMCYVAASRYGLGVLLPLREIELDDIESSFDSLAMARDGLMRSVEGEKELGCWAITRTDLNDGFFSKVSGFVFSLRDGNILDIVAEGNYRRISPTLFVAEGTSEHVIVGQGFLVGTDYKTSYKLRDAKAHCVLPNYAFEQYGFDIDRPLESIARYYSGDNAFCIHPEELASAMDREERKRLLSLSTDHPCPICGTHTEARLFCNGKRCR